MEPMKLQKENTKYLLSLSTDDKLSKIQNLDIYRILKFKMNFIHNEIKCKYKKSRELKVIIFDVFGVVKSEILFGKVDIYKLHKKFPKEKIHYLQFSAYFMTETLNGTIKFFNFYIKYSINMEIIHYIKELPFTSNMYDEFNVKNISLNK